ncbi:MAG TPA: hypothetical protein VFU06_09590, partial [Longimicrobiales bacterium]|nr:hypothetical protein [Longimicrobiales bacterium]
MRSTRSRALRSPFALAPLLLLGGCIAAAPADQAVEPAQGYEEVAAALEQLIRHEMADKDLPA